MKRFRSNLYTAQKIVCADRQHVYVENEDGYLFAQAIYPTKIKAEDLPEWYVYGRYYKCFGYLSAKGVVLPHDLTFGNASHGRVATHLRNLVHVHGDEQRPGSDVCRRARRFAARVASTNHYHIVFKIHVLVFSAKVRNKFDFLFVLL